MVVLRSTTPCVAVNSRSNSTLLTVISIVATATAASTGIAFYSPLPRATFITSLISNIKPIKPAVTVGRSEKWKTLATDLKSPLWGLFLSVRNRSSSWRRPYNKIPTFIVRPESCTVSTSHSQPGKRKTALPVQNTKNARDLTAQLLCQLIEQPVQIFIVLADLFDLLDRVQNSRMMLSAELPPNLRQRSFGHVLRQIHRNLPRIDDCSRIILCLNLHQPQPELLGHHLLDGLDCDLARLGVDKVLQHLLRIRQRDLRPNQR